MKKNITLFLFLPFFVLAQEKFIPLDTATYAKRKELIATLKQRFDGYNKKIEETEKGKIRKALLEYHKEQQNIIIEGVNEKEYIFDNPYQNFAQSLIDDLTKTNPDKISKDILLLFSQSAQPNAFYIGYNIVVVNLGLFMIMDNPQQIEGTVAHEFGHQIQNHVEKAIKQKVEESLSEKLKNDIKLLKREKTRVNTRVMKLIKGYIYEERKIKRKDEIEADSIAFLLFKKAKINPKELVSVLSNVKNYEKEDNEENELTLKKETYRQFFELPNQPFKDRWLEIEDYSSYKYGSYEEKFNKDSISTHPETEFRIKNMQKWMNSDSSIAENKKSKEETEEIKKYKKLKQDAIYQQTASLYYFEDYGQSLYYTLHLLQENPNDVYLKELMGKNFMALHKGKKEYKLNRYVKQPNPEKNSKEYIQFLSFIWNLNLSELETIGKYYSAPN